jgi:membrane peptidoglycan carboxypeptidase
VWFSGFVPQMATSVGLYKPDENGNPTPLTDSETADPVTGATIPADIWLDFMLPTFEGVEALPFPDRAGVGDDKVPTTTVPPTTTTVPPTTTTSQPPTKTPPGQVSPPPSMPTKTPPGKSEPPPTSEPTISVTIPGMPSPTSSTKPPKGNGSG